MTTVKSLRDLADDIVYISTNCNNGGYPTQYQTYDEAWSELFESLSAMRRKLGEARYLQLVDMAKQAKVHYEAKEVHWASWLMQDMEQIVKGKPPFAYPKDMYRWPGISNDNA